MTLFALIGASAEANGHPGACTEPAPGSVTQTSTPSVTVNGTGIATAANADINIPSHGHSTDTEGDCINFQTHNVDPDASGDSSSVTVNGSPVYLEGTGVATDPGSGGSIDIINTGSNSTVSESP